MAPDQQQDKKDQIVKDAIADCFAKSVTRDCDCALDMQTDRLLESDPGSETALLI
jgi:hypothetical protein